MIYIFHKQEGISDGNMGLTGQQQNGLYPDFQHSSDSPLLHSVNSPH